MTHYFVKRDRAGLAEAGHDRVILRAQLRGPRL